MTPSPALRVERMGKRYRIGARRGYRTLQETVSRLAAAPLGWLRKTLASSPTDPPGTMWALRDVTFSADPGEVVGIVGANGAGKTTLLKILSRITEPTEGYADIHGRVGSLLEVGTGFHPELTGRENIFLNGAILGMKRSEIVRSFDEIVAFAEVDRFIDTPIKHYSTGMHFRLAFAVAAHLDTDILMVDEVLAVGDAGFRKKCLGKMSQVAGGGKTVLLVSHNMGAIKAMSSKVLWLRAGQIVEQGDPREVVDRYLTLPDASGSAGGIFEGSYLDSRRVRLPKYRGEMRIQKIELLDEGGRTSAVHREGATLLVAVDFSSEAEVEAVEVLIRIKTLEGQLIFTGLPGKRTETIGPGEHRAVLRLPLAPLLPGVYQGDVLLFSHNPQDNVSPGFQLEVVPDPQDGEDFRTVLVPSTVAGEGTASALGLIRVRATWESLARQERIPT